MSTSNRTSVIDMWTDGSCKPHNPGIVGGWAAILYCGDRCAKHSGSRLKATNNEMELSAVIEGLKFITRPSTVVVHTDSAYVAGGINTWLPGWQRKNWLTADGSDVKNAYLWRELAALMKIHVVTAVHVPGHAHDEINNECDRMAAAAADALLASVTGQPIPGSESVTQSRLPVDASAQPEQPAVPLSTPPRHKRTKKKAAVKMPLVARTRGRVAISSLATHKDIPDSVALRLANTCNSKTACALVENESLFPPHVYSRILKRMRKKNKDLAARARKKLNVAVATSMVRSYPDKETAGKVIDYLMQQLR